MPGGLGVGFRLSVLAGGVATPGASEQTNLRPRIYIVVRSQLLTYPAGFSTSSAYFAAVGTNFLVNTLWNTDQRIARKTRRSRRRFSPVSEAAMAPIRDRPKGGEGTRSITQLK